MELWDGILAKGYDEIVYIPMSSGLSGSCQSAALFAQDYDSRVQVVDNRPHLRHPEGVGHQRPSSGRAGV